MTAEPPAELTRVRDHSHDPAVAFDRDGLTVAGNPPPVESALMERIRDDLAVTYPDGHVTETITGWMPPRHHCPDGICADMAAAFNLDEQAADHRSLAAWARTAKNEIRRARMVRGKRVKMLRRALEGTQP